MINELPKNSVVDPGPPVKPFGFPFSVDPLMMTPSTFVVPSFQKAPPFVTEAPLINDMSSIVTVFPVSTWNILEALFPETVRFIAPSPEIVRFLLMVISPEVRVIV